MSTNTRSSNRRVGFSPDINYKQPEIRTSKFNKKGYGARGSKVAANKKRVNSSGICGSFRILKSSSSSSSGFSAVKFLKRVGSKVAKALRLMSSRKKRSRKVSSASLSLARSRSYAETLNDSQRAEAIEDCIEFLNSSSSLQRSNSVASSC